MITVTLTPQQFAYLQEAVRRDVLELEDMAPWEIDQEQERHQEELRRCWEVAKLLTKVEQEQVAKH